MMDDDNNCTVVVPRGRAPYGWYLLAYLPIWAAVLKMVGAVPVHGFYLCHHDDDRPPPEGSDRVTLGR